MKFGIIVSILESVPPSLALFITTAVFQIQNVFKHPFLQQYKTNKESTYLTPIETGSAHFFSIQSYSF